MISVLKIPIWSTLCTPLQPYDFSSSKSCWGQADVSKYFFTNFLKENQTFFWRKVCITWVSYRQIKLSPSNNWCREWLHLWCLTVPVTLLYFPLVLLCILIITYFIVRFLWSSSVELLGLREDKNFIFTWIETALQPHVNSESSDIFLFSLSSDFKSHRVPNQRLVTCYTCLMLHQPSGKRLSTHS